MRRTLASLGIFGIFTAGFITFKDKISFVPNIGKPSDAEAVVTPEPPTLSTKPSNQLVTKGVQHENSHRRSRSRKVQRPGARASERASDESDEIESLASIYQDQEAGSEGSSVTAESVPSPDVAERSSQQPSSRIAGVKVAAWLHSKKNAIPTEVPDPSIGTGMRYFLNCMELKKQHLTPLDAKDCDALITDRRYKN